MTNTVVGLCIGSKLSRTAIMSKDLPRPDMAANSDGERATPTVVALRKGTEWVLGDSAVLAIAANDSDLKVWDGVMIEEIIKRDESVATTEEELTCIKEFIKNIWAQAEDMTGQNLTDCVVTVPNTYSESECLSVSKNITKAGYTVIAVIKESTASLLSFSLTSADKFNEASTITLFDLGENSATATVFGAEHGILTTKASVQTTEVGTKDIIKKVFDFAVKDFSRRNGGVDLTQSEKSVAKLQFHAANAVRVLSNAATATIAIEGVYEGMDMLIKLSKPRFDSMFMDVLKKCTGTIDEALSKASISKEQVDLALYCGGGCTIPKVCSTLKTYFEGTKFFPANNYPEEASTLGAAIHAYNVKKTTKNPAVVDFDKAGMTAHLPLSPVSVGIISSENSVEIIKKGELLPSTGKVIVQKADASQTGLFNQIGALVDGKWIVVGQFLVDDLTKADSKVEIELKLDTHGVVTVIAKELLADRKAKGAEHHYLFEITN